MLCLVKLSHAVSNICELSDRVVFLLFSILEPQDHKPTKIQLKEVSYSEIRLNALDLEGLGLLQFILKTSTFLFELPNATTELR